MVDGASGAEADGGSIAAETAAPSIISARENRPICSSHKINTPPTDKKKPDAKNSNTHKQTSTNYPEKA
jgi:hypothetical protein